MRNGQATFSIGQAAALACVLEATAAKPGNVHRGADFDDMSYVDLLTSAWLIAPILDAAPSRPLGETVLAAVEATQQGVGKNTNLGIVLLIAPLAKVCDAGPLQRRVREVLSDVTEQDAHDVYAAIRLAKPGGLGAAPEADVSAEPTVGLVEAMRLAAGRDLVARQYAYGFADIFDRIVPWLEEDIGQDRPLAEAIVRTHLRSMAELPDTLIMRKCGPGVACEAQDRAAAVLSGGKAGDESYERALADFDFWLRSDGRRRNPGATADLMAAGLFVVLREGILRPPFRFYS